MDSRTFVAVLGKNGFLLFSAYTAPVEALPGICCHTFVPASCGCS